MLKKLAVAVGLAALIVSPAADARHRKAHSARPVSPKQEKKPVQGSPKSDQGGEVDPQKNY